MENYNQEPFPKDISTLFETANNYAVLIQKKLNADNCPFLGDLYNEDPSKNRVNRNRELFESLGYNKKSDKFNNEFKGLYVFGEEVNGKIIPVYIGISRTVYRRLRQHGYGKTSNSCTLAYLMAKHKYKTETNEEKVTKSDIENETHLKPQKEIIQNYKVVLIPVEEDYNLYFLEVAIAGILQTKWNSFRTH